MSCGRCSDNSIMVKGSTSVGDPPMLRFVLCGKATSLGAGSAPIPPVVAMSLHPHCLELYHAGQAKRGWRASEHKEQGF